MANRHRIPHGHVAGHVITTHAGHTAAAQGNSISSASVRLTRQYAAAVPVYTKAEARQRFMLWRLNLDFTEAPAALRAGGDVA